MSVRNLVLHGGHYRSLLHEIALEMFSEKPLTGWGGGSFLYNYASYEHRVPEMAENRPNFSYYLLNSHADGDWYQFLAEYGLIGSSLFAAVWVPILFLWCKNYRRQKVILLLAGGACCLILYHGLIDRPFRNTGVVFMLWSSGILVCKAALLNNTPSKKLLNTGNNPAP